MIKVSQLSLTDREKSVIMMLIETIIKVLRGKLTRVVIFGSRARGDFGVDSDIDILVVVKQISSKQRKKIYETLLDLELENDTRISLVFYSELEYQKNMEIQSFFIDSIERDGVELWANQELN